MAQRIEIFDIECAPSTPASTPVEVLTPFPPGLVEKVWIVIPDGHAGLTGIALAVAHEPVVPRQTRGHPTESWRFVEGNAESIPFDLDNYPDSGAWSAWVFNTDLLLHHWQLRFEINELPRTTSVVTPAEPVPAAAIEGASAPPPPEGEGEPAPAPPGGELPAGETPPVNLGPGEPVAPETPTAPVEASPPLPPAPSEPPPVSLGPGEAEPPPVFPGEGSGIPGEPPAGPPGAPPKRKPAKKPPRPKPKVKPHKLRPPGQHGKPEHHLTGRQLHDLERRTGGKAYTPAGHPPRPAPAHHPPPPHPAGHPPAGRAGGARAPSAPPPRPASRPKPPPPRRR